MRIPVRIIEHPIESALAGLLLMALLFVSIGPEPQAENNPGNAPAALSSAPHPLMEKM